MKYDDRSRPLSLLSRGAAAVAFILTLAGCVNQTIDDNNKDEIFHRFTAGEIRLSSGLGAAGNNVWFAERLYQASAKADWSSVAKLAIESDSGDDIGYYYLGLAAENFKYSSAARTYYLLSIKASTSGQLPPQCSPGVNYIGAQCHGLVLPRDAYAHLNRLPRS